MGAPLFCLRKAQRECHLMGKNDGPSMAISFSLHLKYNLYDLGRKLLTEAQQSFVISNI